MNTSPIPIPKSAEPIVKMIGLDLAVELLSELGGAPVHMSSKPRAGSRLVEIFGFEKASIIGSKLGPGEVTLPTVTRWLGQELKARGFSNPEIAIKLHVSVRSVYRWFDDKDYSSLPLFDKSGLNGDQKKAS